MTDAARSNPYVGPRAFRRGDRLYGRDREAKRLLDLLIAERVVLLHAPSGAGKTSLVEAKLIPSLLAEGFAVRPPIRVHHPFPAGVAGTNRYVFSSLLSLDQEGQVVERADPEELARQGFDDYLAPQAASSDVVLIFDQFEEILTVDPNDTTAKAVFFERLGALLRHRRFWALFCLREDYLAGLDPYWRPLPARSRLDLLGVEGALPAIRQPARDCGVEFDPRAAQTVIDELRRDSAGVPGPYVEPVQLQVVCRRLWDTWAGREPQSSTISPGDVEDLGDIDDALSGYFADAIAKAADRSRAAGGPGERTIREWVEETLISRQGSRNLVALREATGALDAGAIVSLIDDYLLRKEERSGGQWLELAHDRLIEPIRRSNAEWRAANRVAFQVKVAEWIQGRRTDSRLLLGAAELREAERWATEYRDDLSDEERDFLDACRRALTVERRTNLSDLGWGVIYACDPDLPDGDLKADRAIREALRPLLDHRRDQANAARDLFKEMTFGDGRGGMETVREFLDRHKVAPGPPDPAQLPYYLLIVGDPTAIPFEFQYGLDSQYAVGRIHFDTTEEYANYARNVVRAESAGSARPRRAVLFNPKHPGDQATQFCSDRLIVPLLSHLVAEPEGWEIRVHSGPDATKARLMSLLGDDAPALLFVACQGMSFPESDPRQAATQGALICQDWPGPLRSRGAAIEAGHYFAAADVAEDARLDGLIAFFLGPYTVGTPEFDDFPPHGEPTAGPPRRLAESAFVSRLPCRLLGHPGGALAVIGHVERMWATSFTDEVDLRKPSPGAFPATIRRLMGGHTVGSAMEPFNQRHARMSLRLYEECYRFWRDGRLPGDLEREVASRIANLTIATIDARNFLLFGDPATRFVDQDPAATSPVQTPLEMAGALAVSQSPRPSPFEAMTPGFEAFTPAVEPETLVIANGIDGQGGYALPPLTSRVFEGLIVELMMGPGEGIKPESREELSHWRQKINQASQ